jgi:hypothetical protein
MGQQQQLLEYHVEYCQKHLQQQAADRNLAAETLLRGLSAP